MQRATAIVVFFRAQVFIRFPFRYGHRIFELRGLISQFVNSCLRPQAIVSLVHQVMDCNDLDSFFTEISSPFLQ